MSYRLHCGDCLAVLRTMPENSVDSVVTDPPYHLTTGKKGGFGSASVNLESPHGRARIGTGFMGMKWDGGDIAFRPQTWAEVLRVLKPGGYLLAFGGTRTYHRLVCAIEDGGFEVRDMLEWIYGSGFPKSTDKAKIPDAWQGWNTALKPAHEPICMARKPMDGTLADNLAKWGTGAIWIDGCRIPLGDEVIEVTGKGALPTRHTTDAARDAATIAPRSPGQGRWPANLIHDGSDEVLAIFPDEAGQQAPVRGTEPSAKTADVFGAFAVRFPSDRRDGGGSAARFFWCPKASRADRNDGCDDMPEKPLLWSSGDQNPGAFQSANTHRAAQNNHPTVKPTELMRYLCRLVTPPSGTVLDIFNGSGSTGRGAVLEGLSYIGIDDIAVHIDISRARIERALLLRRSGAAVLRPASARDAHTPDLFGVLP